jgi:uncharacterized protein (TIGR02217 family)
MPIIVFSDVLLPNSVIAAGVRGKNRRLNSRVQTDSGNEAINIVWSQTLREYEIGIIPMRVDQWQAIETLHEITDGGAYGFLMEDPKDNSVTNGIATQVSAGVYQLHKRYTHALSTRTKDRPITRPLAAGFVIKNSGVPLSAGAYTLNVETGQITIPSAPPPENLTWSGRFLVPVHFLDDFIDWDLVVPGAADARFLAGPSVVLQEIRE